MAHIDQWPIHSPGHPFGSDINGILLGPVQFDCQHCASRLHSRHLRRYMLPNVTSLNVLRCFFSPRMSCILPKRLPLYHGYKIVHGQECPRSPGSPLCGHGSEAQQSFSQHRFKMLLPYPTGQVDPWYPIQALSYRDTLGAYSMPLSQTCIGRVRVNFPRPLCLNEGWTVGSAPTFHCSICTIFSRISPTPSLVQTNCFVPSSVSADLSARRGCMLKLLQLHTWYAEHPVIEKQGTGEGHRGPPSGFLGDAVRRMINPVAA